MNKEQLERMRKKLGEVRTIVLEDTADSGPIVASFDHLYGLVTTGIKDVLWKEHEAQHPSPETPP